MIEPKSKYLFHFKIVGESVETRGIARNYYKTKYQFSAPFEKFPLGWNIDETSQKLGSHCLPFVIESRRNGRVIDRRCMRIFPNWMKEYVCISVNSY